MVKKKRQEPYHDDDSSTESCDEKSGNNCQGTNSLNKCQHLKKAVDVQKLRKLFKNTNLEMENCSECLKTDIPLTVNDYEDQFEYDKTLWLCLKCGSQLCGRSKNKHALIHFQKPRSDCHALAINTTTFEIWCYSCDDEVNSSSSKKLLETVEFVKKISQKPPALTLTLTPSDEINEINNIKEKITETFCTMRPLLSNDLPATTTIAGPSTSSSSAAATSQSILMNCYPMNVPLASSSGQSSLPGNSGGAIPGMARRVQQPTIITTSPNTETSYLERPLPRVRGLTNLGNTCFFNAVLQCLAQTPYLLEILQEASEPGEEFTLPGGSFVFKDGQETYLPPVKGKLSGWGGLTAALAEALGELQTDGGVFRPSQLFGKLTTKCPQFRGGDQHDSHELLRHLLESVRSEDLQRYQKVILQHLNYKGQDINSVGEEMKQKCKIYGQQAGDRILRPEQVFRGFLVSTLNCQDCFHTSSRHENFLDMSLPVSVEKPQPPIRRKTSPETSPLLTNVQAGPSKHQLKKEKEKERKAKRAQKHHNKRQCAQNNITLIMGPAGDNAIVAPSSSNTDIGNQNSQNNDISRESSSSGSSDEQSDADVEDNLIDDAPKRSHPSGLPALFCDSNGNNQISSPLDPEKRGDSPENPNKDSNDENDSGIAASPANTNGGQSITSALGGSNENDINVPTTNLVLAVGISEKGANLVRQNTAEKFTTGGGPVDGNSLNRELEKLNLQEKEILEAKKKAKQKRIRTQSHSDWSTTIAPRYQCEDGECSIQSCLNNFTAVELMTGNNKVGCDGCTQRINGENGKTIYTNATKQFLISSPPAVLILHLKRFQVGPRCMFRKLNRPVSFPMVLDIAPFCGSKVKNLPNIDRKQKRLLYSLYGIVEHSGGMYVGHYTAYVKVRAKLPRNDNRWKFMPQGSKAELDQTDEQKAKLDELLAKEKARELRMKANDSDDYSSSNSSSEQDYKDCSSSLDADSIDPNVSAEEELEGAVGGSNITEPNIEAPPGKWYYVSDTRVQEVSEDAVLRAEAYLLFYERIY